MNLPQQKTAILLPHHIKQLAESGITVDVAIANGIYSETDVKKIAVAIGWKDARKLGPCLMFPVRRLDGSVAYTRLKPDRPRLRKGEPIKYESPKGVQQQPYFPAGVDAAVSDATAEIIFTEGEKKSVCGTAHGFPCIGLTGVHGWKLKDHHKLTPALEQVAWQGRKVFIAYDSDAADNDNVLAAESQLAEAIGNRGATVKVIRIPCGPDGAKQGVDDFIVAHGPQSFRELVDKAEDPEPVEGGTSRSKLCDESPEDAADLYVQDQQTDSGLTLRNWQGSFYKYHRGRYEELTPSDIKNDLVRHLQKTYVEIKSGDVTSVLMNVAAKCGVLSLRTPPVWLDGVDHAAKSWSPDETFATRSHLINLRLLCEGSQAAIVPTSPAYFNFAAADYDFNSSAPPPMRWLEFLGQLWPDDPQSIQLLRQWMGYLLTCDTSQQKILLMVGPKRSGKGTIARIIRSIVGERNCCAPTLSGLATNFGLSPLLGKSCAIIGDARLSRRTDVAATTERLLSISGEDAQTVDRKHRDPVTVQLPTRFTIISNELPSLDDASGALAGRLLILRLTKSFFGEEDKHLSADLAAERESILLWAIVGWKSLRDAGRFTQPESGQDLVDQMEDLSSPVSEFVRERCKLDDGAITQLSLIYNAFVEWSESRGVKNVIAPHTFSRDLTAAFPHLQRIRSRPGSLPSDTDSLPSKRDNGKVTVMKGIEIE